MDYTVIIVEKKGPAVWITLNRPHHKNAYVAQTFRELLAALDDIENDPDITAVVIKGAGDSFCSGADLKDFAADFQGRLDFELMCDRAFERLENLNKVVIAMVQGYAMAGGFELTQICDMIIADENCRIGDGHKGYALPTMGCTQRLPRLIGIKKAKEILYTGDLLTGKEAERIGLVNYAVPTDKLVATVEALIAKLVLKPVAALATMKSLVNYTQNADLTEGVVHERNTVRPYLQQHRAMSEP